MKSNLDLARALFQKAEHDLKTAQIGIEHESPLDTTAFHIQQCAEKLIKALLACRGISYPKTHDLEDLLDLLPPDLTSIQSFRERLLGWNSYAVEMRYDAEIYPEKDEIEAALDTALELRAVVEPLLH